MKSYDEIYQSVLRRRDVQMAKKRRRIGVAGSVVLPAVMLSAAVGVGVAAWQGGPADEVPLAQNSKYENVDIEVVDGKAVVSKCSLGGYTAELELTDITHEPTAAENYFSANSAAIRVTDPNGNIAENVLSYSDSENLVPSVTLRSSGNEYAWQRFLDRVSAEHIGESLKLYELDDNGEKHYALALRSYESIELGYAHGDPGYATLFFSCEPYSFDSGDLNLYGWVINEHDSGFAEDYNGTYTAGTSDDMRISGMSIINDGAVDMGYWAPDVYKFDPANCSFTHDQVPQLGGDVLAFFDEVDGYYACLRLKGLTHVPEEGANYYTAEDAVVTVANIMDGTKATVSLNNAALTYEHFVKDIQWEAEEYGYLTKSGVKLLPIEFEGERHYVLAVQRHNSDYDTDITTFYSCEPDCFASGILYPYFDRDFGDQFIFSIAEDFRLLEGNTYIEYSASYEEYIRFDPVNRTTTYGRVTYTLAEDDLDGYTVSYELQYVTHVASFRSLGMESPDGYYAGEDVIIRVADKNGRSGEISLNSCGNSMVVDEFVNGLRGDESASFYYCIKLMKLNDNGTDRYVIMLRNYHNYGHPMYRAAFFGFDPESFTLTPYANGAEMRVFAVSEYLEIESKDGADVLVTETWDFNDIDNVNDWDYGTACCNSMLEFDHENHIVLWSPLTRDSIE